MNDKCVVLNAKKMNFDGKLDFSRFIQIWHEFNGETGELSRTRMDKQGNQRDDMYDF